MPASPASEAVTSERARRVLARALVELARARYNIEVAPAQANALLLEAGTLSAALTLIGPHAYGGSTSRSVSTESNRSEGQRKQNSDFAPDELAPGSRKIRRGQRVFILDASRGGTRRNPSGLRRVAAYLRGMVKSIIQALRRFRRS